MKKYIIFFALLGCQNLFAQTQIATEVELGYNSQNYVNVETSINSDGLINRKRYIYPCDLLVTANSCSTSTSPDIQGLRFLIEKNIINVPVETYVTIEQNGVEKTTSAERYTFWHDKPYPKYAYKLETLNPIGNFATSSTSNCQFSAHSSYKLREIYNKYDKYGNLLEKILYTDDFTSGEPVSTDNSKFTSYIYSYKGAYKIAEVDNAKNNEIAYTAFETSDHGNWTYDDANVISSFGTMGYKVFNLNAGQITISQLPVQKYIVSYWRKSTSTVNVTGVVSTKVGDNVLMANINGIMVNYVYVEHIVNNTSSITITGTGIIDELRLYPYDAHMETYTYKPLVGVSSKCDVNSKLSYYEYDEMGRLNIVRDQNKGIIKKMEYKIQQPD